MPRRMFGSSLLDRIKEGKLDDVNPIDVLQDQNETIDAASYDLLFDRFFLGDWGPNKPKN